MPSPAPWRGLARPLAPGAVEAAARTIGCEPAVLRAVIAVEASGRWFEADSTLPRRLEPHHLPAELRTALGWSGGWRAALALSSAARRALFDRAAARDLEAACRATSWGGPQVMGFNAGTVGYDTAEAMVRAFAADAQAQLDALVSFLRAAGLLGALRAQDWRTLAEGYNGTGQADAYAARLAAAYAREAGAPSAAVLRLGARGASVIALQCALEISPDGVFGPDTRTAVEAFQRAEGLPVDGVVGARTWAALREDAARSSPAPAAQPDMIDRRLDQVQRAAPAVAAVSGALGGLLGGLGDTAQTILAGGAALALVALAAAWAIGRARAGRAA